MKFIHLADAHLDSPFLGLSFLPFKELKKIKETTEISFRTAVDDAIDQKVDLFLIAGDTFDSIHPSPESQLFLSNQIQKLIVAKIQVVMILGNHDYIDPKNLLLPQSPYFKLLGSNEKIETFEAKTSGNFKYQVVGFSYQHNHITQDKIKEFPQKNNGIFTFGLMHAGQLMHNKHHDNYAPFTIEEVKNLNYDYFALGHIHLRQILSSHPLIAYSGNLQGRHINEQGAKGYYLGTINEKNNQVDLTFKETSPVVWKLCKLKLSAPISQSDLINAVEKLLKGHASKTTLFALKISGAQFLSPEQRELIEDWQTWEQVSNELPFNSKLVKIYLLNHDILQLNKSDAASFEQAKNEVLNHETIDKIGTSLAKKNKIADEILHQSNFYQQVKDMAEVKLGRELKDFDDETN